MKRLKPTLAFKFPRVSALRALFLYIQFNVLTENKRITLLRVNMLRCKL